MASTSVDWMAVGTNAGILLASASALILGVKQGLKRLAKGDLEPESRVVDRQIAGATILETTSMLMWSESNRDVTESVKDLCGEVSELRKCCQRLTEELRIATAIAQRR